MKSFSHTKKHKNWTFGRTTIKFCKKTRKKIRLCFFLRWLFYIFPKKYSFRIKDINLLETDKDIAEIKRDTDTLVYISNKFNPEIISNSKNSKMLNNFN